MCLTDRVKHSLQGLLKPSNNLLLVTVVTVLLFGLQQQVKNRILLFFRVIISGTGSWGQEGWKKMNEMYDWCPLCAVDNNCVSSLWLWVLESLHESEQHVTFTRRQCDERDEESDLSLSPADNQQLNETLATAVCIHCETPHGFQSRHIKTYCAL